MVHINIIMNANWGGGGKRNGKTYVGEFCVSMCVCVFSSILLFSCLVLFSRVTFGGLGMGSLGRGGGGGGQIMCVSVKDVVFFLRGVGAIVQR